MTELYKLERQGLLSSNEVALISAYRQLNSEKKTIINLLVDLEANTLRFKRPPLRLVSAS